MAINGESLVAAPVERRRSFHCWKGDLSSWNGKIVVNAVFLTCGTFISGFRTVKNYWRRASKWTSLGFRYSEMMIFGKMNVKNLSACGNRSFFFICRPEEITSSSRFCGWPTSWACQVLSRDQDHIQLCNVSSRTPRHIIEVQLQLVSWQLAGRELPQRNIKSVWKNARELPQRRIKSVIKITGNFHSVTSGRCLKLQENFHSVASEACLKLQENFHSVASRRYSPQPPKTLPP